MNTKFDWKAIAERASWTFVQAALAVLVASGTDYVNVETWKAAGIAGGAAVFSVLKNIAYQYKQSK